MEQTLVQKLIQGSHNIDRMRKEIEETLSLIIGFLKDTNSLRKERGVGEYRMFFNTPLCRWNFDISISKKNQHGDKCSISCLLKREGINRWCYLYGEQKLLKLENVQVVHKELNYFLIEVFKKFPILSEVVVPLIDAN